MALTLTSTAPSAADAQRAADAIASSPGVVQVLLFGSVARGDQHEGSDVDLMVVFDDIDYEERGRVERTLKEIASNAAGRDCDVQVTDLPEWENRQKVSSSFERVIAGEAMCLASNEPRVINKDKEMVKPMSNQEEALEMLENVTKQIQDMKRSAFAPPDDAEVKNVDEEKLEAYREKERLGRMCSVCGDAAMLLELASKSLVLLHGEHPISDKQLRAIGHDIDQALDKIKPPMRDRMREAILRSGISIEVLSSWRILRTYGGKIATNEMFSSSTALRKHADEQADNYVDLSLSVTLSVLNEIEVATKNDPSVPESVDMLRIALADFIGKYESTDIRHAVPLSGGTREGGTPQPLPAAESETDNPLKEMDDMVKAVESAGPQLSQHLSQAVCDRWMPNAKTRCVLGKGHRGNCRSK